MSETKKEFWEGKILKWEADKYSPKANFFRQFLDVNYSVKNRLRVGELVLSKLGPNLTVLDLGCGTARLLPVALENNCRGYTGIDFSSQAISSARDRTLGKGNACAIELIEEDINKLKNIKVDYCFSLGLLDWLTLDEVSSMLKKISCRYYLHSFSRYSPSFSQVLHRLYVYFMYGHKTKQYVPNYYRPEELVQLFSEVYSHPPKHFHSRSLSFSSFVYQLPFDLAEIYE